MIADQIIRAAKMRMRSVAKSLSDDYVMLALNMGISDLYNRFNLKADSEIVHTVAGMPAYEIRDPKIQMLIGLYKPDGTEMTRTDVLGSRNWDWKQVNYRSFLLNKPRDGHVIAVYKSLPDEIVEPDAHIDMPDSFMEALMLYMVYMISGTTQAPSSATGHGGSNESVAFRQMYESECNRLIMMGYKVNLETERPAIQTKGYV